MFAQALEKETGAKGFWRMLRAIFHRPPPSVRAVVELSGNEVKILSFRKTRPPVVHFLGAMNIPSEIYENGIIKDTEGLRVLLQHLVKTLGRKMIGALVVLPEEKVFTKIIQAKTGEIHAVEYLARQALPLPPEEMIVTTKEVIPLSRQITHKDYNLWAVERAYLEAYRSILLSSGLMPAEFLPESLAIVTALFPKGESQDASLIIVPQKKKVTFLIFAGRAVHFSETLFGKEELPHDQAFEDELVGSVAAAISFYRDKVLHEHGASSVVNRILVVGELGEELEARLAFNTQMKIEHPDALFQFQFPNETIKKIATERQGEWISLLGGLLWISHSS